MDESAGPPGSPLRSGRTRARKPSFAERRERRAGVEDLAEVLDAAARFLEARPRSVAEVRRRLTTQGYRTELVDAVLERLTELGYLDDEAFATAWVESRDRARPRGEHALRRELGLKGVDRTLVDAILAGRRDTATGADSGGEEPADPDAAAAERLLRKRLGPIEREADPRRRRQRAYALLARNGFSPDVCSSVSRAVLDGSDPEGLANDDEEPPDSAGDRGAVEPG
jgi:regulatory protein